jgi:F420-dependent oxidoreductase-like protein
MPDARETESSVYRAAVPAKALTFSLCLDTRRPWPDLRSIGAVADSAGWHCIYVPDHFMPHDAGDRPRPGPVLEAWSCLTALAMLTEQVRVGTLVLGSTYRHPAVVANMAATVDQLSAGRLTLGLGAGWQTNEHRAYGIALPDVRERLDRFEEACAVIRALTRSGPTTYRGVYYAVQDAFCEPPPAQPALPILIGGGGERRTLAIAARSADAWHTWATSSVFRRKSRVLDRHCEAAGRAPDDVRRICGASVRIVSAPGQTAAGTDGGGTVVGTAESVAEAIDQYRQAGVEEFVVRDDAGTPAAEANEFLSQFQAEVVRQLR